MSKKYLQILNLSDTATDEMIEKAVEKAIADGHIKGTESFPAKVTLEIEGVKLNITFDGEIRLQ